MAQINVQNLTFYYEGSDQLIFDDVSFQIDTDWKLGMTGRNGRGKTTFLRLLAGDYEYRGKIASAESFEYFPYPVGDKTRDTIEVIEEADPSYELWKVCRELNLMEVDCGVLYRPFCTLSSGEQTKVLLAVLFAKENRFLLIDEPTNHLDMENRIRLGAYLNRKKGFLLVSHDRDFLDSCVDHILAINRQDITVTKGNFSVWWEEKKNRDQFELDQNEKLKKDIRKLEKAASEAKGWSDDLEKTKKGTRIAGLRPDRGHIGHMAAKMMKRSKNLEHRAEAALEEKKGLLKNLEETKELKLVMLKHHKEVLVRMEDMGVSYGGRTVLENFCMEVRTGERVALRGGNGCGKSSLIKALLEQAAAGSLREKGGEHPFDSSGFSGRIETASGLVVSYVPQETSWLSGGLDDWLNGQGLDRTLVRAVLRNLDFSREQFERPMEAYSEGQKKKVLLAASLCRPAHLYLWDEPLNYIDIFSRMQIEALILRYRPTMLMVEHDARFVRDTADRVVWVQSGDGKS